MHDDYSEISQMIDRLVCEKFRGNTIYELFMGPYEAIAEFRRKYPNPTWEVTKDE